VVNLQLINSESLRRAAFSTAAIIQLSGVSPGANLPHNRRANGAYQPVLSEPPCCRANQNYLSGAPGEGDFIRRIAGLHGSGGVEAYRKRRKPVLCAWRGGCGEARAPRNTRVPGDVKVYS
jgi:hypothetical protein